jgi:hypothetical protein
MFMTDRLVQYHSDRFNSKIESDVSMLSEEDKALISQCLNKEWTNPKFKLRWFVGQTQITPFAKLRQWLLEIKSREESIENQEYEIAKWQVKIDRQEWIAKNSPDVFERREAEIESWNLNRLQTTTKRRLQDWYLERQQLIDLVQEFLASDEAKLPDGTGRTYMDILNTSEEDLYEAQYWTNRLAKQAATDLMFYGRIGTGNMDAILSMDPAQQTETLALAINFGTQLQQIQNKIQSEVDQKLGITRDPTSMLTLPKLNDVKEQLAAKLETPNSPGDQFDVYNT